jgi:uncharacterized 2Fe-2S/4Fe-4S cluster protein (DUF4445 family)
MPSVRVEPDGNSIQVARGDALLDAVARAGVIVEAPCGGRGNCGKCLVRIIEGEAPASERCAEALSPERLAEGWRLACQIRVENDLVVEVPAERRIHGERIVAGGAAEFHKLAPRVFQVEVSVPEPSLADQRSDLDRLLGAGDAELSSFDPQYGFLRGLPTAVRAEGGQVVVTVCRRPGTSTGRLISVAPASKRARLLGVSFDIGTTTLVGELWDLAAGRRLSVASRTNPQRECGDDVISRADLASKGTAELDRLQNLVAGGMTEIIEECLVSAGASAGDVHDLMIAGNTVMAHLFFGVSPENIAQSPFAPVFTAMREAPAAALGLPCAPGARVAAMPAVSGYVGGDIVAGLMATELLDDDVGATLFIDVGTNGEMVLVHDGAAVACATAAGPAFEGARISRGMRAMSGAIEEVKFDGTDLVCPTIDNAPARGICGTGLIDAVAVLAAVGVIDETGRMLSADELPENMPAGIRVRLREGDAGPEILLGENSDVPLTQRDVRELQLAKAAIRAGADTLLAEAGLQASDLARVVIGGAFGSYIDRESALGIGLLPPVAVEKVSFAGNTSATGARLALLDTAVRARAEGAAREVRYLELSGRPDFQNLFAEAMMFPTAGKSSGL